MTAAAEPGLIAAETCSTSAASSRPDEAPLQAPIPVPSGSPSSAASALRALPAASLTMNSASRMRMVPWVTRDSSSLRSAAPIRPSGNSTARKSTGPISSSPGSYSLDRTFRSCAETRRRSSPIQGDGALLREPAYVENAKAKGDEHAGDQPEADHDRCFCPAGQLEVVLQGGHPEHPFMGQLVGADLDRHRQRDDHEQAAEQDQQQLGPGDDRQAGQRPAEGE